MFGGLLKLHLQNIIYKTYNNTTKIKSNENIRINLIGNKKYKTKKNSKVDQFFLSFL